jgi:hypothetical protein
MNYLNILPQDVVNLLYYYRDYMTVRICIFSITTTKFPPTSLDNIDIPEKNNISLHIDVPNRAFYHYTTTFDLYRKFVEFLEKYPDYNLTHNEKFCLNNIYSNLVSEHNDEILSYSNKVFLFNRSTYWANPSIRTSVESRILSPLQSLILRDKLFLIKSQMDLLSLTETDRMPTMIL